MRRTSVVVAALAACAVLVGCGSSDSQSRVGQSSPPASTSPSMSSSPTAEVPPATVPSPAFVAASAVPAVTGRQGAKPAIAKPTGSAAAPTTLLARDVIAGSGATAKAGSLVSVNYTLALYATGAVVQSSYDAHQPFAFRLGSGQVIPGFDAGVSGMKAGGRRELVIPPSLGYGDQASADIPAGSTLIFVVDLVSTG